MPGAFVAAGHGMLGVTYALGTGRLVAELIAAAPPSIDVGPFSPHRFQRRKVVA